MEIMVVFGCIQGGLGNQLFQICHIMAHAIDCQSPYLFIDAIDTQTRRNHYWNSIFKKLYKFVKKENDPQLCKTLLTILREKSFAYCNDVVKQQQQQNVCFVGYYQSYKYFQHRVDWIFRVLGLESQRLAVMPQTELKKDNINISIHFRIGDYVKLPNHYTILSANYYLNALRTIQENVGKDKDLDVEFQCFYFCEETDLFHALQIIQHLQSHSHFSRFSFARIALATDWEEMLAMSWCDHHIIANSTFSWWGAFVGEYYFLQDQERKKESKASDKSNKYICYPQLWFGPKYATHQTTDLCPEHWISVKCEE